jgi:hypothetical protein
VSVVGCDQAGQLKQSTGKSCIVIPGDPQQLSAGEEVSRLTSFCATRPRLEYRSPSVISCRPRTVLSAVKKLEYESDMVDHGDWRSLSGFIVNKL